ncbi:uncharacterized protein ISCGN_000028 [Ixodes scapularis]
MQGEDSIQTLPSLDSTAALTAQALPTHTEAQSSKVQNCDQESVPQVDPPVGSLQVSVQKSKMAGSILIRTVGQRSVLKQRAVPSFLAAGSSVQPCTPQGTTASKGAVPSSLAAGSFFQPGTSQGTSVSKGAVPSSLAAGSFFQPGIPQGTSDSKGAVLSFLAAGSSIQSCTPQSCTPPLGPIGQSIPGAPLLRHQLPRFLARK